MYNLETPYDEETEFIECTVCDKSIRGDSLYKIHLATPGHRKKADTLVAVGRAEKQHMVPVFEDILQFLDYMKLEEPIIGLSYLEEIPIKDLLAGPKYLCRLCHHTAHLPEMVHHVIGRKHRQKYLEEKRPDLVTWDKKNIINQGGKIIRARAEMVERQDGRGFPMPLLKKVLEGESNMTRAPQTQKQHRDQNYSWNLTNPSGTSYIPPLMDFDKVRGHSGQWTMPSFHVEDHNTNQDRLLHRQENALSYDRVEEEQQRRDDKESNTLRQEYMDPDYRVMYKNNYVEDPQRRTLFETGGVSRYDSEVEKPLRQAQHEDFYSEETANKRPYPDRDALKEFYSEEPRSGEVRSAQYQQPQATGDNHWWSLDRECGRNETMKRAGRDCSSEPESKRRSFPSSINSDHVSDPFVRDYGHQPQNLLQELTFANPGPSRRGPSGSQRQVEVTRSISDIPEPFRRFLTGPPINEGEFRRKQKSRFSDATAEEVEMTKEMFSDEFGHLNSKFGGCPRSVIAPMTPEIRGTQHPDIYTESQGPQYSERYRRAGSDSNDVFDALKNVDIENAEEADFLKNKLCDLLKEFKAKKSENSGKTSHSRAVIIKEYNNKRPESAPSPRSLYETVLRDCPDFRRQDDFNFQKNVRERTWTQEEPITDKPYQEYQQPGEGRHPKSHRRAYEEVFGQLEMSPAPGSSRLDDSTHYSERFQEPMHPRDYGPPAEDFFDSRSSHPLHAEQRSMMDRGHRYSNNLEKITSTLLELVSRK